MYKYEFTRDLIKGSYNINNILRENIERHQVLLYQNMNTEEAFVNKFNIVCNKNKCEIYFEFALSTEQENILNNIVQKHKNNT